jgi:hypothetical protein
MATERRIVECGHCEGEGHIEVGRLRATKEMAMDGGDLSLEGTDCGPDYAPCPACGGCGQTEDLADA